jgi:hypothetical protein
MRLIVDCQIAPRAADAAHDAVRNAIRVRDQGVWYESFAADPWLHRTQPVPVTLDHYGEEVGFVTILYGRDKWHRAELHLELDDDKAALVQPGMPVSIEFHKLKCEEDVDLALRRHTLCRLDAVALLVSEKPGYWGKAKVTNVTRLKSRQTEPDAGEIVHEDHRRLIRREGCGQILRIR